MNIGYPNATRTDIFTPEARQKLGANHTGSNSFRMGMALQRTQSGIFAGVDLHLSGEHRAVRKAARRAKGKAQRQARKASRA
jgi:hypothetical protein